MCITLIRFSLDCVRLRIAIGESMDLTQNILHIHVEDVVCM